MDITGRAVKIHHFAKGKDGRYILREVEHGVVLKCYKHHFSVRIANHIECFRYNELTGNESTKVILK